MMALTMRRTRQFAIGLTLLTFAATGAVSAQINPTVAKSAAQGAAQTASQKAAGPAQSPAKSPAKSATQTPAQPKTQSTTQSKTQAQTKGQKPVPPPAPKTATQTGKKPAVTPPVKKPVVTPLANAQAKGTAKPPAKAAAKAEAKSDGKQAAPAKPVAKRDPFVTLVGRQQGGVQGPSVKLPPGKAGLQISTLMIQGIVSGPNGMIALVANPQKSVYFLRVGDELFDGRVDHIDMNAVTFHEVGKDAFGKPLERQVIRRLNPSSGEQP